MGNLKWSTLEYEEKERSADWFWALGIIVVAGSVTAIILNDYFFAILLVLGGLSFGMFAIKKPEMIHFELNEKGLQINTHLYEYKMIKAFFVRDGEKPMLFLRTRRVFIPMISSTLNGVSPETVRGIFLAHEVPEEEMREHFSEKVMDRLGI